VSWATTNLKEAGGKSPHLRTETSYRRAAVGDAAKQAKAPYCTEPQCVNAEVTWAESIYTYPERSGTNHAAV
jgi:hypothetical protein